MGDFTGKSVLISGATQGIGLAAAERFAAGGALVHITGTRARATDYDWPLEGYEYHQLDVFDAGSRARLCSAVGDVDVLVNNAGGGAPNEYQLDGFELVLAKNLTATMDMCVRLHEGLARRRGNIVNLGSAGSFVAMRDNPAYAAAKSGLLGLTRSLMAKWTRLGIRVNMVAPGFIETRLTERHRADDAGSEFVLKMIPMRRWGGAQEVAEAIVFLASERASYITGTSLTVDGGLVAI